MKVGERKKKLCLIEQTYDTIGGGSEFSFFSPFLLDMPVGVFGSHLIEEGSGHKKVAPLPVGKKYFWWY